MIVKVVTWSFSRNSRPCSFQTLLKEPMIMRQYNARSYFTWRLERATRTTSSELAWSYTNSYIFVLSVCRSRVDLGILIDGSRSVGRRNFRKVIDFVKSFVSFFPLSARETRVGVMVFSSRSRLAFGLNRYGSRTQVVRAINRIRFVQ